MLRPSGPGPIPGRGAAPIRPRPARRADDVHAAEHDLIAAWRPVTRAWGDLVWAHLRDSEHTAQLRFGPAHPPGVPGPRPRPPAVRVAAARAPARGEDADGDVLADIGVAADPDQALLLLVRILECLRRARVAPAGLRPAGRPRPSTPAHRCHRDVRGARRLPGPTPLCLGRARRCGGPYRRPVGAIDAGGPAALPSGPTRSSRRRSPQGRRRRSSTPAHRLPTGAPGHRHPRPERAGHDGHGRRSGCPTSRTPSSRRPSPSRGRRSATAADLCRFAVIGMGKCGARELNYVSDVDVIFVAEARRRR